MSESNDFIYQELMEEQGERGVNAWQPSAYDQGFAAGETYTLRDLHDEARAFFPFDKAQQRLVSMFLTKTSEKWDHLR